MASPSNTDHAYFMGIIDGEGYVGVGKNHGIILCMADVAILYWCEERFGGKLSSRWKSERGGARSRRIWGLRAHGALVAAIPSLLPYAVLKRRELELCREYSLLSLTHARTASSRRRSDPRAAAWHAERDRIALEATRARAARKLLT